MARPLPPIPNAKVTQVVLESISYPIPYAVVSQVVSEALSCIDPLAVVSQMVIEVLASTDAVDPPVDPPAGGGGTCPRVDWLAGHYVHMRFF